MANCVDELIIGQGLAGSLLAWELIQRGHRVMVVDNGDENASQIAAGLVNPVTGLRLVKSTDVDWLLATAKLQYSELTSFFKQTFYVEKSMLRIFVNHKEIHYAEQRLKHPEYVNFFGLLKKVPVDNNDWLAPLGLIEQKQTGYLLTKPLLKNLKHFLTAKGSYQRSQFDYAELRLGTEPNWRDIKAKRVIFCEGYRAQNNPWFKSLPFQSVKGEILTLQSECQHLDNYLLNYGHWLIPLSHQLFRTGATFNHEQLDNLPTEAAKKVLLASMQATVPNLSSASVVGHHANVRPCTLDKQPFIGLHPQHPELAIFNGFGAKGSLQIPAYSQLFAESLNQAIPEYANIQRFYGTHFPNPINLSLIQY